MPQVFISYRRDDSPDVVGRIHDHLTTHLGEGAVFKDVDSIPLGADFREVVGASIAQCEVLLAVIGPGWLGESADGQSRRIDDETDYVRLELELAQASHVTIIPVLVGGTSIPQSERLPDSLRELPFLNGMQIRPDPDFNGDISRLLESLPKSSPRRQRGANIQVDARPRASFMPGCSVSIALTLCLLVMGSLMFSPFIYDAFHRSSVAVVDGDNRNGQTGTSTPPDQQIDITTPGTSLDDDPGENPPEFSIEPGEVEPSPIDAETALAVGDATTPENVTGSPRTAASMSLAMDSLRARLGRGSGDPGASKGRAGRAARWILNFNTDSANSYLAQLGGLDADVCFPMPGGKFRYFSDLNGSRSSQVRSGNGENRISWFDNNPSSFRGVAQQLGQPNAPYMVAFLPIALEEHMLKLELAYQGVDREDEIAQTVFEAWMTAHGWDLRVVSQRLHAD